MAKDTNLTPDALVSSGDGVLVAAHGCGFSLEAVKDLRANASPTNGVLVVYVDPRSLADCEAAVAALPWWGRLQHKIVGDKDFCRWLGNSAQRWAKEVNPDGGIPVAARRGVMIASGWPDVAVLWNDDDAR